MGRRQLHLNAFLMSPGHHEASWRLTESDPLAATDVATTRTSPGLLNAARSTRSSSRTNRSSTATSAVDRSAFLEPLTLLTVLAGVTERIGLIATASTSYNSPYNLARRFASLDHVSNGRAGWNIVTTATLDAARNFGLAELPSHSARYARAAEFVDVTQKLWDSWEDDTIVADKRAGVWGDQAKIHAPEHHGEYFSVQGALNIPAHRRGIRFWFRPGHQRTARPWRPGTPRPSSPLSRRPRRRDVVGRFGHRCRCRPGEVRRSRDRPLRVVRHPVQVRGR